VKKILFSCLLFSFSCFAYSTTLINGAGATFPYPLYSKWFAEYQKTHSQVHINYQSIGSGGGIRQFLEKTVDFGATDLPMTDEQLKKSSTTVLHIPTTIGAVVLSYLLPSMHEPLKLTPQTLASIFLGKITKWNDPALVALNPGLKNLSQDILVVHRADGSGTTGVFTDYLSKVSSEWKSKAGSGTAIHWPTGLGGKGNEGVMGLIKQTPGSIGYVELIYAKMNKHPYAWLQNKSGQIVEPTLQSVAAAVDISSIPADFRVSLTDSPQKSAYPLSSFTYLLVNQTMDKTRGEPLLPFLRWSINEGQSFAEALSYTKLPKELIQKITAKINEIRIK